MVVWDGEVRAAARGSCPGLEILCQCPYLDQPPYHPDLQQYPVCCRVAFGYADLGDSMVTRSPASHAAGLSKCLVAFMLVAMVPPVALAGNPSKTGSVAEPKESVPAGAAEAVESQVSELLAGGHCAEALAALLRMQATTRPPHMMIWLCRAQYRCGSAAEAVAVCNAVQAPTGIFLRQNGPGRRVPQH